MLDTLPPIKQQQWNNPLLLYIVVPLNYMKHRSCVNVLRINIIKTKGQVCTASSYSEMGQYLKWKYLSLLIIS